MSSFSDYSITLGKERLTKERVNKMINNIDIVNKKSSNTLSVLVNSFEQTIKFFKSLKDGTSKVRDSMEKIMESLQFQDITKQQMNNI
jgi:hypothetical protein